MLDPESLRVAHERTTRVFRYLQALNRHRNPAPRQLRDQPWSLSLATLPAHPSILFVRDASAASEGAEGTEGSDADLMLRVRRPRLVPPPAPPPPLAEWLTTPWDDPLVEPGTAASRDEVDDQGATRRVSFDERPERVEALASWMPRHAAWASEERQARAALRIFEQLYELHGRLEREGERLELLVADGILSWRQTTGGLFHPVLLQRVQLRFNSRVPEFTVSDSGRGVDLYSELFSHLEELDGRILARCREELQAGGVKPLGGEQTSSFLRRLLIQLSARGELLEHGRPSEDADPPRMGREPVLLLRSRSLGFARALEGILESLEKRPDLPSALARVVGCDVPSPREEAGSKGTRGHAGEVVDVLLSKQANAEQEEIASRLARNGCVLVQGPPGTGKTHTIANLIGHLLAEGKSVLVTSHTTKALRVLRGQVVPELQPLCVSVLDNDLDSRAQLEGAVSAMAERLSVSNGTRLDREASSIAEHRERLKDELQQARQELLQALSDEYRDVVVAGQSWSPSEAARRVAAEPTQHLWLPGPVMLGAALPLSEDEVRELYRGNAVLTPQHETELACPLPRLDEVMSPGELGGLLEKRKSLRVEAEGALPNLWQGPARAEDTVDLTELARRCLRAFDPFEDGLPWKLAAVSAGLAGDREAAPWRSLIDAISDVRAMELATRESLFQHAPVPAQDLSMDEQLSVLAELQRHLEAGGTLGAFTLLTRSSWKRVIRGCRVEAGAPRELAHFAALSACLSLRKQRQVLARRWDGQMAALGAPLSSELGEALEERLLEFRDELGRCLDWAESVWRPLDKALSTSGMRWKERLDAEPINPAPHGMFQRRRDALVRGIAPALRARAREIELERVREKLRQARARLEAWGGISAGSVIVRSLAKALEARDGELYARAFVGLTEILEKRRALTRRQELLTRLKAAAPGWASAIRERRGVHARERPPGAPQAAWCWRQLHDELERRGGVQLASLQSRIEVLSEELRKCTAKLIERRAWASQAHRTTLGQQQALVGWLDIQRRIGKGTGVRAPRLRAQAAQLMSECQRAVPVWIMPLTQVVENFTAATRFDVVIIDEASQCDAMGLISLYLADRAVVVGDHEQVSPSAVGQNVGMVEQLIAEHLAGIPNAVLYDGKMSVYDLARQSFSGMVCLLEHFRCVPDIIEFSNQLSYEGRIKPLREAASAKGLAPLNIHRVEGHAQAKVNEREAIAVASLIAAAVEHPAYAGRTFGVISLVGEEQALKVDSLLQAHLSPAEYERRRVLCGSAAQFQGDERDVMFLSMVDSPDGDGPLSRRETQDFKQRFNVAVSRARDQLWVVHSLNPSIDLQPGDLRRRLLEHCAQPQGVERALLRAEPKTESPFEKEVLALLVRAGYRVTPQWRVGHYRIDLVVEGGGRRLAVECDGDRYHPLEKLPDDMARQALLERLGWRFVRIRGSAFFRDPEAAMRPVFARLKELEIPPEGAPPEEAAPVEDALRAELVRRAEAIAREWEASPERFRAPKEARASRVGRPPRGGAPIKKRSETTPGEEVPDQIPTLLPLEVPLPAAQVVTPRRPRVGSLRAVPREQDKPLAEKDPLPAALRRLLTPQDFLCQSCRGERRLWIGERGPFLKCAAQKCLKTESVRFEVLVLALELRARCSCGAFLHVARGVGGAPRLECTGAGCSKRWPWRQFRDQLRGRKMDEPAPVLLPLRPLQVLAQPDLAEPTTTEQIPGDGRAKERRGQGDA
nr:AAA domain-containing protein [Myxococcus sp. MH1]